MVGTITIEPSYTRWYTVAAPLDGSDVHIRGRFFVNQGQVHAALFDDESEVKNWANGQAARTLWATGGRVSAADIECCSSLGTGTYYLAFGNRIAMSEGTQLLGEALRYGVGGSIGALMDALSPERQSLVERLQTTGQNLSGVLSTFVQKQVSGNISLVYQEPLF